LAAIETERLSKSFADTRAVDDISITIPSGSIYGFLGPNGAGKTTTLRMLVGLARPDSGGVTIEGKPAGFDFPSSLSSIGYLPDEPRLYGWMTATEYLRFSGGLYGMSGSDTDSRCKWLLAQVGLDESGQKRIGSFSRGMKKRLGIAQALVNHPKVLILDEPTANLDPAGRESVLQIIRDLQGETTVLMSTHYLDDVEKICDHVGFISQGKIVLETQMKELNRQTIVRSIMLETAEADNRLVAELSRCTWVDKVNCCGNRYDITVTDIAAAQKEIPRIISSLGIRLVKLEVVEPGLEELFLSLTQGSKDAAPAS